ncbi:MAG: hypothetical protein ABSE48_10545 [Verrucomicrobiota bacterium]
MEHGIFKLIEAIRCHIAKKFQRDVKLLWSRPANQASGSVLPQLVLSTFYAVAHVWRNSDRQEKTQQLG